MSDFRCQALPGYDPKKGFFVESFPGDEFGVF